MFKRLFEISCSPVNSLPVLARNAKTMEELGEFSEALLHKLGFLPHKSMKEPIEGETADVIICAIDALAGVYPDLTPDELTGMLRHQIEIKSQKWIRVIAERGL